MVKQYVYVDTAATAGDLVSEQGGNTLKLNINGLLENLPPYVNVKLVQLEYITEEELMNGLVLKITRDASNQLNLNKTDSVLGICTFEYTRTPGGGGNSAFHYENHTNNYPVTISGNIQELSFYFADTLDWC